MDMTERSKYICKLSKLVLNTIFVSMNLRTGIVQTCVHLNLLTRNNLPTHYINISEDNPSVKKGAGLKCFILYPNFHSHPVHKKGAISFPKPYIKTQNHTNREQMVTVS